MQRYMSYAKHYSWSEDVSGWTLSLWIHYSTRGNLGPMAYFDFESWSVDGYILEGLCVERSRLRRKGASTGHDELPVGGTPVI